MGTVRYTVLDGEVIAEKRNGVRREYVPDPLGSTAALLDNAQTQTDMFSYWPYGEEASRKGTTPTPFRFVGTYGYYRDSIERNYVRARYLRMQAGRWLTQDPISFSGGDWNLFRYVVNNCTTGIDPSGHDSWSLCCNSWITLCCPKPKPKPKPKSPPVDCGKLRCMGFDYCADLCDTLSRGDCVDVTGLVLCIEEMKDKGKPTLKGPLPITTPDPGLPDPFNFPTLPGIGIVGSGLFCRCTGLCCGISKMPIISIGCGKLGS